MHNADTIGSSSNLTSFKPYFKNYKGTKSTIFMNVILLCSIIINVTKRGKNVSFYPTFTQMWKYLSDSRQIQIKILWQAAASVASLWEQHCTDNQVDELEPLVDFTYLTILNWKINQSLSVLIFSVHRWNSVQSRTAFNSHPRLGRIRCPPPPPPPPKYTNCDYLRTSMVLAYLDLARHIQSFGDSTIL